MRAPESESTAESIPDRRKRGRRAADYSGDLDGAYNDGAKPNPLTVPTAVRLYGSIVWIVITSAIGTLFVLKAGWMYLSQALGHP
jgi:hypothetical protein